REWVLDDLPLATCLESLLGGGVAERCETVSQITEFVLAEPIRRSATRSLLFAAPGEMLREVFEAGLDALGGCSGETAISILGEPPKQDTDDSETSLVRWVSRRGLGKLPLFLIYFGDGSAYAMICEDAPGRDRTRFFQTCDRNLVEHLALRVQHELHGPGSERP
ncbi:MAG: hypothetical protein IH827_02600, partial [Myxococcales bacterium]|nr:hypothetical protein [Myxococcales bacterium]